MALSNDLISQFVKVTKDKQDVKKETVVYGTVDKNDIDKVIIDGSTISTPVTKTVVAGTHDETENGASVTKGDRVIVTIKNHTATVTGNLSRPSARAADTVSMINLDASNAKIDNLESAKADVQDLIAVEADVEDLKANKASVDSLLAVKADITNLKAADATITNRLNALSITAGDIEAASAFVKELKATGADVGYLVSTTAEIDNLIFGSASGDVIQTSFSNAVIAQLGDAQIKSAMIDNISASKITSGDIITNNVRVKSQNGSLIISDETLQIRDGTRVRVQVGKDAASDYSINIWDQNGNLMFSKGGITDAAIKEAIIRNDMVSDTANIHASKLDVDSLFEEINGSANTIKSTQIYVDEKKQTLDVAFKSLTTEMTTQGQTISSQGTQISAMQGQISSKIWQQDIDTARDALETQTEALSTRYSTLEQNLNGFKAIVSDTYATKEAFDGLEIGGRNLALGTSDEWSNWVIPNADSLNQTHVANYAYLSDTKQIGDEYTVSIEIEFSGVDVGTGGSFLFRTQGSVDDTWSKNNIWAHNLLNTKTPLSDGVYRFFLTTKIDSSNIDATRFDCGFRADYWNGTGKYRYRKIKVEKGSKPTDWSPAPEDLATIKNLNTLSDKVSSAETKITQNYDSITAVATRTTKNENAITSLELTANGLTAKVESAKKELYHSANGSHGVSGYVGLCQLEVTGVHQDRPLLFEFTNRGRQSSTVSLCFSNIDSTDPGIHHLQRDGGIDVWAYKIDTSTWQLIAKKSEAYDTIYVKDYYNTNFYVTVTWTNIHYNTLPDSNITEATLLAGKIEKTVIDNAAKTATNYLNFSSNGLVVGDMTASSLGKNVLIDSDSVDIRNCNTTLASFGADYLYLAKNSRDAKIDLCNSLAQMYHEVDDKGYSVFNIDTTYGLSYIKMSAPMSDLLVLENTNSTNGVIIKGIINGTTVGGFGLLRDGNMVRYGSDADEDDPVKNIVLDTGNFLSKMDDGWHYTGGYGDNFTQYNNDDYAKVRYRKIGGMVEIRGVMRPTTIIAGSSIQHELFSLPEGYRPDSYMYQRCQADGVRSWLLTISPSGVVSFSRYGNGTSYIDAETTAWLPFQVTYFVN